MRFQLFFLAGLAAIAFNGCEKDQPLTSVFKAKYVAGMCGQDIVEILDRNYYDKGIIWSNTNGQKFEHVFTVKNHCDFSKASLNTGEVFNCQIIAKPGVNECVVCMAFMETPPKTWNVKVVK
jgi:hypothetical protein